MSRKCRHYWIQRFIMKNKYWIFLTIVLAGACSTEEIPRQVLELVDIRMKIFRAAQDSICKATATLKAEQAVDSFFLTFQKQYLLDSIQVPPKPIKPSIDTILTLDKSLPVKPLWDSLSIKQK